MARFTARAVTSLRTPGRVADTPRFWASASGRLLGASATAAALGRIQARNAAAASVGRVEPLLTAVGALGRFGALTPAFFGAGRVSAQAALRAGAGRLSAQPPARAGVGRMGAAAPVVRGAGRLGMPGAPLRAGVGRLEMIGAAFDSGRAAERAGLYRQLRLSRADAGTSVHTAYWVDRPGVFRTRDAVRAADRGARGLIRSGADSVQASDGARVQRRMVRPDAASSAETATRTGSRALHRTDAAESAERGGTQRNFILQDGPRAVAERAFRFGARALPGLDGALGRDAQASRRATARLEAARAVDAAAAQRELRRADTAQAAEGDASTDNQWGVRVRFLGRVDAAHAADSAAIRRVRTLARVDAAHGAERVALGRDLRVTDRARFLDVALRRVPIPERSYAVIYERTGPYLQAFSGHYANELTLLPATTADEFGTLSDEVSGEELGLALAAASLNGLPVVVDLAELMERACVSGLLPAFLTRDGQQSRAGEPDEEIRAALYGAAGFIQAARHLSLPGAQQDALLDAGLAGAAYALTLTEARGVVGVGGTDMLRESALAGLVLMMAGRAAQRPDLLAAGYRTLLALTARFRSPVRPHVFAASASGPRASLAHDAEGLALTVILALAYDVPDTPDEALADLERCAAQVLTPWTFTRPGSVATLAMHANSVQVGEQVTSQLDALGYSCGGPGGLSGRGTVLAAAAQAQALQHGRALDTLRGLTAMRVPDGPLSHAIRAEARAPGLSLGASVAAEFVFDTRLFG